MFYYELVNMNNLRLEERTVVENIFLVLNQEWNYEEVEETKKMVEMFEESEEIISRFMAIKEIDVKNKKIISLLNLTDEEKKLAVVESPEEWITKLEEGDENIFADAIDGFKKLRARNGDIGDVENIGNAAVYGLKKMAALQFGNIDEDASEIVFREFNDAETEKIKALGVFVMKMAVYRFCTVHFPKIVEKSGQETSINETKVVMLENELEQWEKKVWMEEDVFEDTANIFVKRKELISKYTKRLNRYDSGHAWACIKAAYKDEETFERVKELRLDCKRKKVVRKDGGNKKGKEISEIESMRKVLDIMEKQLNGELSSEETNELKKYASDWSKDIQILTEMINKLS